LKEEEEFFSNILVAMLIVATIAIELVLTITLLVLNALPSIVHGYFVITWMFIAVWAIISVAWVGSMYRLISKRKRKRLFKALRGGDKRNE